jgi:tRNA wybutosine-synthesizing protein 3
MIDSSFDLSKQELLRELKKGYDLSPKGSIDKLIVNLVDFLNSNTNNYVTTSSCSGRTSVYMDEGTTKGVSWLLVRHGCVSSSRVREAVLKGQVVNKIPSSSTSSSNGGSGGEFIYSSSSTITLKCEPFILHLRCRDLASGQFMHTIATACGFRESGLVVSAKSQGKVMLAVRTTAFGLELPIARRKSNGGEGGLEWLVDEKYLALVVGMCNQKVLANFGRIYRLQRALKEAFRYPLFAPLKGAPFVPRATVTSTSTSASIADGGELCQRWGHTCFTVPSWGYITLGGYGRHSPPAGSRRGLPPLLFNSLNQLSTAGGVWSVVSVVTNISCAGDKKKKEKEKGEGEGEEGVHAAALSTVLQGPNGVQVALVTGGRMGPAQCLPLLRAYSVTVDGNDDEKSDKTADTTATATATQLATGQKEEARQENETKKNKKKGPTKAQQQRRDQQRRAQARAVLVPLSATCSGAVPSRRWGHTLTLLPNPNRPNPNPAAPDSPTGDTASSESKHYCYMHGGRDNDRVYGCSYIGTITIDDNAHVHVHWTSIGATSTTIAAGGALGVGDRFYHSCVAYVADGADDQEAGDDDSDGRGVRVAVLVHGGLSHLHDGADADQEGDGAANNLAPAPNDDASTTTATATATAAAAAMPVRILFYCSSFFSCL